MIRTQRVVYHKWKLGEIEVAVQSNPCRELATWVKSPYQKKKANNIALVVQASDLSIVLYGKKFYYLERFMRVSYLYLL